MSLNWEVGDTPPQVPHADPRPPRHRTVLVSLLGIGLLAVASVALASWQRRQRLAAAERAVRIAAEVEQRALAANDPGSLATILPSETTRLRQVPPVRDLQVTVPGATVVGERGSWTSTLFGCDGASWHPEATAAHLPPPAP